MESCHVRIARGEDAEKLLAIYAPYVENTAITFEYEVPSIEEFRERIEHTLSRYPYLVAERGGEIMGYGYASAFKTRGAEAAEHHERQRLHRAPDSAGRIPDAQQRAVP